MIIFHRHKRKTSQCIMRVCGQCKDVRAAKRREFFFTLFRKEKLLYLGTLIIPPRYNNPDGGLYFTIKL